MVDTPADEPLISIGVDMFTNGSGGLVQRESGKRSAKANCDEWLNFVADVPVDDEKLFEEKREKSLIDGKAR